jgi:hypothetical protein
MDSPDPASELAKVVIVKAGFRQPLPLTIRGGLLEAI